MKRKLAVAVLAVLIVTFWASSRWPQQVQAISASLAFLTAVSLVYITWKYVEENQKIRQLMEDQWKEERRLHLSFWLAVNPTQWSSLVVVYTKNFVQTGSDVLSVPTVNLCVWNAGLHAFRLGRVRLRIASAPGTERTIERNVVVGAEKTESFNITTEMLQVISNSAAIEFEKVRLHTEDLEIALDCSGVHEQSSPTRVFRIETKEGEGRLEIKVAGPREDGTPP